MENFFNKNKYSISGDSKKHNQHQQAPSNTSTFTSINQNASSAKLNRTQLQSPIPTTSAPVQAQNVLKNNSNANNVNKSQTSLTNITSITNKTFHPTPVPPQQQQQQQQQLKHPNLELRQTSAKSQDFSDQQKHHHHPHQQLSHSNSSYHPQTHHHQQQHQQLQHTNSNHHHHQQQHQLHSSNNQHHHSHQNHPQSHYHPNQHPSQQQQKVLPNNQQHISREPSAKIDNHNRVPTNSTSTNNNNNNNNNNSKLLNLIVRSERHTSTNSNDEVPLFDPEPARDEAETFSHTIFLDDRSFIVDDDELDKEVSSIISKANRSTDKSSVSSRDSVHIVNEVPEGRLSKKSSRSSQSSVCSNSTRESSNVLAEFSDSISYNTDQAVDGSMAVDSVGDSEGDGYKNEVLDTLIRKFNVNIDENNNGSSTPNSNKNRNLGKNSSDLQKKIQRTQLNRQNTAEIFDEVDNKNNRISKQTNEVVKRNLKLRDIKVNCLPQTFNCKYLGKVRCQGLWGVRYTREPIDRLVTAAKCLQSIDELPSMEALISERGIYIVQKQNPNSKNKAQEKIYRSGLIPISNISYGVQDNKFGKIFSCIVVRERDGKTLCECYAFLNTKAEIARKMALSLTLAFKEYGKLIQIKESNIRHTISLEEKNKSNKESIRDSVA